MKVTFKNGQINLEDTTLKNQSIISAYIKSNENSSLINKLYKSMKKSIPKEKSSRDSIKFKSIDSHNKELFIN